MRLQKYLADAGIASRRKSEELIRTGRVRVNGVIVKEMGVEVDPSNDEVQFDSKIVRMVVQKHYIMLNKPVGVVTTMDDPQGRMTIRDLITEISDRVYPVGRLDYDTEGMLLLTNDGELANRLMHPRYQVDKQYRVRVGGTVTEAELERLRKGITLPDGHKAAPCKVRVTEYSGNATYLEVIVHEGHNRLVRQMFEALDRRVAQLKRERIGTLYLGGLAVGRWRHLKPGEVKYLKQLTGMQR